LNYRYSFADSDGCVEFLPKILGSCQVVGVSMGFAGEKKDQLGEVQHISMRTECI
jgi:hypothetical protein